MQRQVESRRLTALKHQADMNESAARDRLCGANSAAMKESFDARLLEKDAEIKAGWAAKDEAQRKYERQHTELVKIVRSFPKGAAVKRLRECRKKNEPYCDELLSLSLAAAETYEEIEAIRRADTGEALPKATASTVPIERMPAATGASVYNLSDQAPSAVVPLPALNVGRPVHVRGYVRKDGTYVRPHTRSR